ncbi:MAG: Ca-activated chloride channel family protein [Cellvibrionaceae bacterium]|jgi:Ca-activated chloride channel family protein
MAVQPENSEDRLNVDNFLDFHWLRPWYLLTALPLLLSCVYLWHQRRKSTGLERVINPSLLSLLISGKQQPSSLPIYLLAAVWLAATIALAGPTWERRPQAVFTPESLVIIALDLSQSMLAEDVKPSRMVRAQLKIQQFLESRKGGLTALIVYGGEAFVVTPLTKDQRTIANLLPTLTPNILPIPGSNVEMAIELAEELLDNSGYPEATLLIVSDGIPDAAIENIPRLLSKRLKIRILGVGTEMGAPIPYGGSFLRDATGNMIIAQRNDAAMKALAQEVNGYYLPLQADASDVNFVIDRLDDGDVGQNDQSDPFFSDEWYELGPTLLLFALPLAALIFRRGWLLSFFALSIAATGLLPQSARAAAWDSLWLNSEQQGKRAWDQQNYSEAEERFSDPIWRGSSLYRQGQYEAAARAFQEAQSAIGDYNRGNALAQLQRFDDAIRAYDQALAKDPSLGQAKKNKARLEELLRQESSDQSDDGQESDGDSSQDDAQSNAPSDNQSGGESQENSDDRQNQQSTKNSENQDQSAADQESIEAGEDNNDSSPDGSDSSMQQNAQTVEDSDLSAEQQQALQQWLRKIPDDPSGLLRRKFQYEYEKRRHLYQGRGQPSEKEGRQRY